MAEKSQKTPKNTSNRRKNILISSGIVIGVSALLIIMLSVALHPRVQTKTKSVIVKNVSSEIFANGTVAAQNEATLSFLTGGKLVYAPFKEGDYVSVGQTVASLDSYALQKQVQLAANTYQITKNNTATTNENFQAQVLEGQQRLSLDMSNKNSYGPITQAQVITDEVQRIIDNANLTENSAQLQVDLANYAASLTTLTSPISGILTRTDVVTPNVNVTPATQFVVSDPDSMVFRAQVLDQDIDFISIGAGATVHIDGIQHDFPGTVIAIHPAKVAINGQNVYLVDVSVEGLKDASHFGQGGAVKITSNSTPTAKLIPTWLILNNQYVWVQENGKNMLKKITVGKTHGSETEILSGLTDSDRILVNPEAVIAKSYLIN